MVSLICPKYPPNCYPLVGPAIQGRNTGDILVRWTRQCNWLPSIPWGEAGSTWVSWTSEMDLQDEFEDRASPTIRVLIFGQVPLKSRTFLSCFLYIYSIISMQCLFRVQENRALSWGAYNWSIFWFLIVVITDTRNFCHVQHGVLGCLCQHLAGPVSLSMTQGSPNLLHLWTLLTFWRCRISTICWGCWWQSWNVGRLQPSTLLWRRQLFWNERPFLDTMTNASCVPLKHLHLQWGPGK